eukprot:754545-Hanusia_phi.AAC.4
MKNDREKLQLADRLRHAPGADAEGGEGDLLLALVPAPLGEVHEVLELRPSTEGGLVQDQEARREVEEGRQVDSVNLHLQALDGRRVASSVLHSAIVHQLDIKAGKAVDLRLQRELQGARRGEGEIEHTTLRRRAGEAADQDGMERHALVLLVGSCAQGGEGREGVGGGG